MKTKAKRKLPMFGVGITSDSTDVLELLKAAARDNFAPNDSQAILRCIRIALMPQYGHMKRVQKEVAKILKSKGAK